MSRRAASACPCNQLNPAPMLTPVSEANDASHLQNYLSKIVNGDSGALSKKACMKRSGLSPSVAGLINPISLELGGGKLCHCATSAMLEELVGERKNVSYWQILLQKPIPPPLSPACAKSYPVVGATFTTASALKRPTGPSDRYSALPLTAVLLMHYVCC